MLLGIIFYLFSIYFGTIGKKAYHFWLSLFFCGLGWNFLYVGGSDEIAKVLIQKKGHQFKELQFYNFFSVSLASLLAGTLHSNRMDQIIVYFINPFIYFGVYVAVYFLQKK